jgi:Adenylosuccinate lyase
VRARFCAALGLADPGISWLTARDRGAEFAQLLALICGTLARIGGEVYELQRPEIGELREAAPAARSAASPCRTSATRRAASTWTRWPGWPGPAPR